MAKTIYLMDRGILPDSGVDCADALQAVFDGISYDGEEVTVMFKKGTYRIFKPITVRAAKGLTVCGCCSTILAHFDPTAPHFGKQRCVPFL